MKLQEHSADDHPHKLRIAFGAISLIIDRVTCKLKAVLWMLDKRLFLRLSRDNKAT